MKKYFFPAIILCVILLSFLFSTENTCSTSFEQTIPIEKKDTVLVVPPTIDEIIKNGIPKKDENIQSGISYETEEYFVVENTINSGEAIGNILQKYNISNTDIYKLEQSAKEI